MKHLLISPEVLHVASIDAIFSFETLPDDAVVFGVDVVSEFEDLAFVGQDATADIVIAMSKNKRLIYRIAFISFIELFVEFVG